MLTGPGRVTLILSRGPAIAGRRLPALPLAIGFVSVWLAAAWNLWQVATRLPARVAQENDFYLYWTASRIGREAGWNRIYDLHLFLDRMRPAGRSVVYLSPPPLAWVVTPLTYLPLGVAAALWTGLVLGAVVLAWHLVAPGAGISKAAMLGVILAAFPVAIGLYLGQATLIVLGAVAGAWWLLERGRPLAAGAVLSLLVFKPELVALVPVALFVAGRRRTAIICALLVAGLAAASLLSLGPAGLSGYLESLRFTLAGGWGSEFAAGSLVGGGALGVALRVAAAGLALAAAWLARDRGAGIPIAAALTGGLLAGTYVNGYEMSMLILAGWLILREAPPPWVRRLLLVLYVPVALPGVFHAGPGVAAAGILLVMTVWMARRPALQTAAAGAPVWSPAGTARSERPGP